MVTPIPFLLIYFLLAREICVRILPLPSRAPTTDMRCNKGPIPFSREAIEGAGKRVRINHTPYFLISREASEKYPLSREIDLKTPRFSGFSRENFPETNGPKYPLSRENGNAHAAPLYIRVGASGINAHRSFMV